MYMEPKYAFFSQEDAPRQAEGVGVRMSETVSFGRGGVCRVAFRVEVRTSGRVLGCAGCETGPRGSACWAEKPSIACSIRVAFTCRFGPSDLMDRRGMGRLHV